MAHDGIHVPHLVDHVIRPALSALPDRLRGRTAERLLLGTLLVESGARYLYQLPHGPARGLFQMEPRTHDDIWQNFLAWHDDLRGAVESLRLAAIYPPVKQLAGNLFYAAAMCRIHYYRDPEPLPDADDIAGLGRYWKRVYNTSLGAGDPDEFVKRLAPAIDHHGV